MWSTKSGIGGGGIWNTGGGVWFSDVSNGLLDNDDGTTIIGGLLMSRSKSNVMADASSRGTGFLLLCS